MFDTIIYEALKRRNPKVAVVFAMDYKNFINRRGMTLQRGSFESVRSYFFTIFSVNSERYHRELRCVTGNIAQRLWVTDFENVICDTYLNNHQTLAISSSGNSELLIGELGVLIGS